MPPSSNTHVERAPVWLDCDPGHDVRRYRPVSDHLVFIADPHFLKDAFAILIAARHPDLKLLGVTSVHGNASLSHTTSNVGSILTAVGSPHIPYYAGAAEPLCRQAVHAPEFHG
ncbi:MAG: hypothetical protein LQ352_004751 [Teloschistes flavicans]|nr:MAG: hypothetical protein LQ352_004751 [Teloschistes flavicans]